MTVYFTLPDDHALAGHAVAIEHPNEWHIFRIAGEAGLPGYKAGTRFYKDPEHKNMAGRTILSLEQWHERMRNG